MGTPKMNDPWILVPRDSHTDGGSMTQITEAPRPIVPFCEDKGQRNNFVWLAAIDLVPDMW